MADYRTRVGLTVPLRCKHSEQSLGDEGNVGSTLTNHLKIAPNKTLSGNVGSLFLREFIFRDTGLSVPLKPTRRKESRSVKETPSP